LIFKVNTNNHFQENESRIKIIQNKISADEEVEKETTTN